MDFRLVKDGSDVWRVRPVKYHKDHIVDPKNEATKTWSFDNHIGDGPVGFRVRALTELAEYQDKDNILLFGYPKVVNIHSSSKHVKLTANRFRGKGPSAHAGHEMVVRTNSKVNRGWAVIGHKFENPINIIHNRVPVVWVNGDGKGEVVNIQLEDNLKRFRDHYIDINFKGWRKITLAMPETRRVWDYPWPYNKKKPLGFFNYDKLSAVKIYLINLTPRESYTLRVGDIVALKELPSAIETFELNIGENRISVTERLRSEEYIECDANGQCCHYSHNGHLMGRFAPTIKNISFGMISSHGRNRLSFLSTGQARARITTMVEGNFLEQ